VPFFWNIFLWENIEPISLISLSLLETGCNRILRSCYVHRTFFERADCLHPIMCTYVCVCPFSLLSSPSPSIFFQFPPYFPPSPPPSLIRILTSPSPFLLTFSQTLSPPRWTLLLKSCPMRQQWGNLKPFSKSCPIVTQKRAILW
jgi:hypothetical protein